MAKPIPPNAIAQGGTSHHSNHSPNPQAPSRPTSTPINPPQRAAAATAPPLHPGQHFYYPPGVSPTPGYGYYYPAPTQSQHIQQQIQHQQNLQLQIMQAQQQLQQLTMPYQITTNGTVVAPPPTKLAKCPIIKVPSPPHRLSFPIALNAPPPSVGVVFRLPIWGPLPLFPRIRSS